MIREGWESGRVRPVSHGVTPPDVNKLNRLAAENGKHFETLIEFIQ